MLTPQLSPTALAAGQVRAGQAQALGGLASAMQGAANRFTEFYEKEAAISRERLLAQAQADWARTYAERAENAGPGFADAITKEYGAYVTQAMSSAPERGKEDLQLAFDKYGLQLQTRAIEAEAAARARAKAAMEAATREARAAALANEKRLMGNRLVSDPTQLSEFMEADPENADYYAKIALDARLRDDPITVHDEVMGGQWDAHLSPSEKMAFIEGGRAAMDRAAREAEVQLGVERNAFEAAMNEEIAYASANGAPPVDAGYSDAMVDALYPPEEAAAVKAQYASAMGYAKTVHAVNTMPPVEIETTLAEAQAKVKAPGNTAEDQERYNGLIAAVVARNSAIAEDAAGFVGGISDETSALYGFYQNAGPEDRDISARSYVAALDYNYQALGVPVEAQRVLPVADAAAVADQFNKMTPDVAAQSMQQYLAEWGDAAPRVARDLAAAGLAPEFVAAARFTDNPGLSARIMSLRGVATDEIAKAVAPTMVSDGRTALMEALTEYRGVFEAGDQTGTASRTFNETYGIAEKMMLQDIRAGLDPAEAAEKAAAAMFPEGVLDEPNARVIVPVGISADAVSWKAEEARQEDAIRAFDPAPMDDPRFPEFADKEIMIAAAENGIWLNDQTGKAMVLHIDVGGYLLPVIDKTGAAYTVPFAGVGQAQGGWMSGRAGGANWGAWMK